MHDMNAAVPQRHVSDGSMSNEVRADKAAYQRKLKEDRGYVNPERPLKQHSDRAGKQWIPGHGWVEKQPESDAPGVHSFSSIWSQPIFYSPNLVLNQGWVTKISIPVILTRQT